VDGFGQSGERAALYRAFGIDAEGIIEAAFEAADRQGPGGGPR
jgi:pyruvate dehydrogenase complex dehydrogenase (E1) component